MATINSPELLLRIATPADLPVLQYWDKQPHVMAAAPDADWEFETELHRNPSWREQLIAELNGRPLGFIQIIDPAREESHYWGEVSKDLRAIDIWIGEACDLGKGYGTLMMHQAITRCFTSPEVKGILIDPLTGNERAQRFYLRLRFVHIGKQVLDGEEVAVMKLDRKTWEQHT